MKFLLILVIESGTALQSMLIPKEQGYYFKKLPFENITLTPWQPKSFFLSVSRSRFSKGIYVTKTIDY